MLLQKSSLPSSVLIDSCNPCTLPSTLVFAVEKDLEILFTKLSVIVLIPPKSVAHTKASKPTADTSGRMCAFISERPDLNRLETCDTVPPIFCITRVKLARAPISLKTTPVRTVAIPDIVVNTIPHFNRAGFVCARLIIDLTAFPAQLTILVKGVTIALSASPIVLPKEASSSSGKSIIILAKSTKLFFNFSKTPPSFDTE